jgi:alkylation response protein AidB-like acyl-CoA dehydrogenase
MRVLADHKVVGPPPGLDYKLAAPTIAELALHASAPSIYGGSDEIQRNILCERTLGLPKEPGPSRDTPFTELAKNG